MNKVYPFVFVALCVLAFFFPSPSCAGQHSIGGGVNYWYSIDEIKDDVDEFGRDGLSIIASYQYWPGGLLGIELAGELMPDRYDESVIAPQAYLLLGRSLYAGVGIGTSYSDGDFADEPFYAFKAGWRFPVVPRIYADLCVNYRFNDIDELKDSEMNIDTDTIFFGAMLRFGL